MELKQLIRPSALTSRLSCGCKEALVLRPRGLEISKSLVRLQPRNTTWLRAANVLFVDNPVGTGFSYVTENSAFTTNEIGKFHL